MRRPSLPGSPKRWRLLFTAWMRTDRSEPSYTSPSTLAIGVVRIIDVRGTYVLLGGVRPPIGYGRARPACSAEPGWTTILRGACPTGIVAATASRVRSTTDTLLEASLVT